MKRELSPRSRRCFSSTAVISVAFVAAHAPAASASRSRPEAAELLVVDQLRDRRVRAAHRAVGILAQLQLAEPHPQRVVDQEAANQRLANSGDQLDGFGRLDHADDAGQHAQDATLGAARHEPGRRRLGIQAAIARAVLRREH